MFTLFLDAVKSISFLSPFQMPMRVEADRGAAVSDHASSPNRPLRSLALFPIVLLLALTSARTYAGSSVLLEGGPGEWVSHEIPLQVFTEPNDTFEINSVGRNQIALLIRHDVSVSHLTFQAPVGQILATGQRYGGVQRHPFHSPMMAGMDVGSAGHGCNTLEGYFEILELQWGPDDTVQTLAVNFKQFCGPSSVPLYGAVRVGSDLPLELPVLQANPLPETNDVYPGDTVYLLPRFGFFRTTEDISVRWEQVSGPPVQRQAYNPYIDYFTVPIVKAGGEQVVFRQVASIPSGLSSADITTVRLRSRNDEQTFVEFDSQPGDYIGGGRSFRLTPNDSKFTPQVNNFGGITLIAEGKDRWTLAFAPAEGNDFNVGVYDNAERLSSSQLGTPSIDVSGDGRGCSTLTGRFDVLDLAFEDGQPSRLAINFEQHCQGKPEALYGRIRYRYTPSGAPSADAGEDQMTESGMRVRLNGGASSDEAGVATYRWRQVGGMPVTLEDSDKASPAFVAPPVTTPQQLSFELVVGDDQDLTAFDSVDVLVSPSSTPVVPGNGGGPTENVGSDGDGGSGGGALDRTTLIVLLLLILARAHLKPKRTIVVR